VELWLAPPKTLEKNMALSKLDNSDPRYREAFGNHDIHQFTVCTAQDEQVGRVVDGLADEAGQLRYLVIELDAAIAQKQVLLPIERFRVNSNAGRVYLNGLSFAQVGSLPAYDPVHATHSNGAVTSESEKRNGTTHTIHLLEEQLTVNREKRKIGEVIVRKEIETQIVEVPVRREKLIVEQVGLEPKQLASIDLGKDSLDTVEIREAARANVHPTISGEFSSVRTASQFLQAIADQPNSGCEKVQISLTLNDAKLQEVYQQWLERYSAIQSSNF
jgi:uncharacterized protein (TIGR02271 family)